MRVWGKKTTTKKTLDASLLISVCFFATDSIEGRKGKQRQPIGVIGGKHPGRTACLPALFPSLPCVTSFHWACRELPTFCSYKVLESLFLRLQFFFILTKRIFILVKITKVFLKIDHNITIVIIIRFFVFLSKWATFSFLWHFWQVLVIVDRR